jgi:L-alanine-DL-glutamate epimerase-like enolase superfamily enzyme
VFKALSAAFPDHRVRIDPNAAWGVEDAIKIGKSIEHLPQ